MEVFLLDCNLFTQIGSNMFTSSMQKGSGTFKLLYELNIRMYAGGVNV